MNTFVNSYTDTRGLTEAPLSFTQAIVKGIAEGGGLYVPRVLPRLSLDEIIALGSLPYAQQAALLYKRFGVDLPEERIDTLMEQAYGANFDDSRIIPIVEAAPRTHVLELWHGPTSAFKDMALQCLPLFFSEALAARRGAGADADVVGAVAREQDDALVEQDDALILVATSGDTGKAALEGFADREHTGIVVFYPHGGVSDIQFKQMATQRGGNVGVFGVRGNFDDCQTAVKAAFNDPVFNEWLASQHGMRLSSANSINWGRLLPQIVYYVGAYAQMVASGALEAGEPLDICVPTGNFGNILAAWYARELGTPIERLYCASNENRVLTDFINSGTYDIAERAFSLTPSPSMDILISSNLERQLFELNGRDPALIRKWMQELAADKRFTVDRATFAALREVFLADWVSNDESLETIRTVFEEQGYLLDPHTAVAWKAGERLRTEGGNVLLVVATAHWSKFGADVYRALNGLPAKAPLPADIAGLSGIELNILLADTTGRGPLPPRLAELDSLPVRFTEVVEGSLAGIEAAISAFVGT